jgi:hypothetical protein
MADESNGAKTPADLDAETGALVDTFSLLARLASAPVVGATALLVVAAETLVEQRKGNRPEAEFIEYAIIIFREALRKTFELERERLGPIANDDAAKS